MNISFSNLVNYKKYIIPIGMVLFMLYYVFQISTIIVDTSTSPVMSVQDTVKDLINTISQHNKL